MISWSAAHRQRGATAWLPLTNAFEFHRQIEVRFGEENRSLLRPVARLKLQAIAHTAGVIFKDLAGSGADGSSQRPDSSPG